MKLNFNFLSCALRYVCLSVCLIVCLFIGYFLCVSLRIRSPFDKLKNNLAFIKAWPALLLPFWRQIIHRTHSLLKSNRVKPHKLSITHYLTKHLLNWSIDAYGKLKLLDSAWAAKCFVIRASMMAVLTLSLSSNFRRLIQYSFCQFKNSRHTSVEYVWFGRLFFKPWIATCLFVEIWPLNLTHPWSVCFKIANKACVKTLDYFLETTKASYTFVKQFEINTFFCLRGCFEALLLRKKHFKYSYQSHSCFHFHPTLLDSHYLCAFYIRIRNKHIYRIKKRRV